jgi:hypothetical protein
MAILKRDFQQMQQNEPNEMQENETSAQENAESPDMQEQEEGQERGQDDNEMPPGAVQATPEEEAEMSRAIAAVSKILYENDSSHQAIIAKLSAENVPPLNKLIDTTLLLVTQVDKKINLDEGIILPFLTEVYSRVYEIAATGNIFTLPDDILKKGLMSTIEMALKAYGVSPQEYKAFAESLGMQNATKLVDFYKGTQQQATPQQPQGAPQ